MRLLLLFLILSLCPLPANAETSLRYKDKTTTPREAEVLSMLESGGHYVKDLPFKIAAFDLNGDGVDEWVFRQDRESGCEANVNCTYLVIGISEGKPILLGNITARKVGIAEEKSYGVRNFNVYNDPNDDFEYQTYVWTPEKRAILPRQ